MKTNKKYYMETLNYFDTNTETYAEQSERETKEYYIKNHESRYEDEGECNDDGWGGNV